MLTAGGEFLHVRGHINTSVVCVKRFQIISILSVPPCLPSSSARERLIQHMARAPVIKIGREAQREAKEGYGRGDGRGGRVSQTRGDREFKQGGKAKMARERK